MFDAIKKLSALTADKVKAIAMEIVMLGANGIDVSRSGGYTLKTMPGEDFFGYRLLADYYVSRKIALPEHLAKVGLPFDDAYALAQQMYDAAEPPAARKFPSPTPPENGILYAIQKGLLEQQTNRCSNG